MQMDTGRRRRRKHRREEEKKEEERREESTAQEPYLIWLASPQIIVSPNDTGIQKDNDICGEKKKN